MASEKTPNLGLNQIDRTSPKTTYFDLEKYLDQNWRAVDDFAGDVNDGVNAIKKRLDTTDRKAVTLEPGVQMVHAEKASPFSLTGLNGRTLVNLLGRWGNLSSLTGITPYQSVIELDTSNKGIMPNSLKVTIKSGYTVGVGFYSAFKFLAGKYYVAIARVKVGNSTNAGISAPDIQEGTTVTDKSRFNTSWFRVAPTSDVTSNIDLRIQGAEGQYSYFEAMRIYEISATEYTALATMTDDQIDTKYPYVDSVMPVRNPYAIRYGENLLPSFYEWNLHANVIALEPYKLQLKATAGEQGSSVIFPCAPNTNYKISGTFPIGTYVRVVFYDVNGSVISDLFSTTIKTPVNCYRMGIVFLNNNAEGAKGTFVFENIMLNIGSGPKPFKTREDSMLALQTDLYADPVTGANADTVFERDGQYFKSKKWQGLTLDGNRAWVLGDAAASAGVRQVKVVGLAAGALAASGIGTKFDGKLLPQGSTGNTADTNAVNAGGDVYIAIPLADSGWADSYFPTSDDIKAYFYGYKAYDANTITPAQAQAATTATWTGTGTKYWVQRVGAANYTQSAPQTSYAGYTPYQLVYQLATPTVEPIVSEGQLAFNEGDNQVEVGTGIVLREKAKLYQETDTKRWNINNGSPGGYQESLLNYRVDKFFGIYRNSRPEKWMLYPNTTTTAGALAQKEGSNFEATAVYTVSYFAFMPSPKSAFSGSYAANEKTLLSDLVESVQQANTRLSVVENKKADKDSPVWITPTLLNGWVASGQITPQYRRVGDKVQIRMRVQSGAIGSAIFKLPLEYRPNQYTVLSIQSYSGTQDVLAVLIIDTNGNVIPSAGSNNQVNIFVEFVLS
ncbi:MULTISPECIES: hypothetical protein [Paenibacillus]|uniref:Tail fiber protein n=2 Tax=Paenibacillus TaxID=44249 RepID=A0ABX2ZKT3_PAEPO|nr:MULTISPECIES: hypothetical protein [Paenibacillus]MDR6777509.1 hypothetical protein [Paenibacillus peoriae]ODA11104.1 hypothetical protein A7312_22630 [Paenibacillus polymyxa]OME70225.1 hypothetical protein BK119_12775 [Paenibacillus peoriae]